MSTDQRRTKDRLRLRRRLIWGTVLPAIILLVLAARFLTLPVNMGSAQEAHGGNDGAGMVSAARKLHVLNIVERWRAPFVEGTGKAISGDLEGGRADLELALTRTKNPQDDCTVRTNLVLTVSKQADQAKEAGDKAQEKAFAEEGLKLIEEGPEGCLDGSDDGNDGQAGRKQQEQKDKLEEQSGKKKPDQGSDDDQKKEDQKSDGDEEEKDPKQKELEERNKAGQDESEAQRRQDEGEEKGGGGVDKPW